MAEAIHTKMRRGSSGKRGRGGFWTAVLMGIAILTITGFQVYWLKNNYDREKENLDITTNASFRETILKLQASKMKLDKLTLHLDTVKVTGKSADKRLFKKPLEKRFARPATISKEKESVITLMNLVQQKMRDSLGPSDSLRRAGVIAIRNNFNRGAWVADSLKGRRFESELPSIVPPGMLDSIIRNPDNIQNVKIERKNNNGRIITISYKEDHQLTSKKDSASPEKQDNVIVRTALPAPAINSMVAPEPGILDIQQTTNDGVFRFLYNIDSIFAKDSVTINEVTVAYAAKLKEDNIHIPFTVEKLDSAHSESPDAVTIGFTQPITFGLSLDNQLGYMLDKLKLPILFSLLLISITIASFFLLYRTMIKQKRLAEMKNDLISNISHELKTPIATVGVAIEALKNFNAMHDPERTKEYLDISQNELQRLNLLVDKVLKLSIFEKKEIELKKERFDYKQLTAEIMNSMKLQFEKYHAKVSLHAEGASFYIDADKLHITSVVYNLLDNALKYSKENPVIHVQLQSKEEFMELSVQDNGIGIPHEYKGKVFDKFFRVPTGDSHNIKGYGLGLSYVAEVVKRHKGEITVDSEPGKGSTFTVRLPAAKTPVISLGPAIESKKQTS